MCELSKYAYAVKEGLEGLEFVSVGLCGTCPDCQRDFCMSPRGFYSAVERGTLCDEGGFSWHPCEACGSSLGGNRYTAHAIDENGDLVHFSVCEDCLCYIANGDEPENWGDDEDDDG